MKQKSDDADQTESRVGNCTDCGGLVSKQANTCPHCGNPKPFEAEPAPAAIESPTPTATHHERNPFAWTAKPTTPREKCPKCQSGTVVATPKGGKLCLSCSYSSEQKISTRDAEKSRSKAIKQRETNITKDLSGGWCRNQCPKCLEFNKIWSRDMDDMRVCPSCKSKLTEEEYEFISEGPTESRVSQNYKSPNQPKPDKQNSNKLAWFVSVSVIVITIVGYQEKKRRSNAPAIEAYESIKQSAEKSRKLMIKSDLLSELVNSHERLVLYHKDQRSRPIEIKQAVDNLKEKITECVEGGALASQEADQYRNLMAAEQFTEAYRLLAIALVKIAGEMGVFDEGN
jgi:cytochrome c-type biogenesis protein CcmH/NrfF